MLENAPFLSVSSSDYHQWLGTGYYFWHSIKWANKWKSMGRFKSVGACVVECDIKVDKSDIFNLVDDDEHCDFFSQILDILRDRKLLQDNSTICEIINVLRNIEKNNQINEVLFPFFGVEACDYRGYKKIKFTNHSNECLMLLPRKQLCIFEEFRDKIETKNIL